MLNVGPLKSTELFISYLKATSLAVILIVSGWIKLTPQNTFVHDPQELKAPLVTDIQMLLRSQPLCELHCSDRDLCSPSACCSAVPVLSTQTLMVVACSQGFRPAFQIFSPAKKLLYFFLFFLLFIRAKGSIQITSNTPGITAFQCIKFSIPTAIQDGRFTCAEAPPERPSKLDL